VLFEKIGRNVPTSR